MRENPTMARRYLAGAVVAAVTILFAPPSGAEPRQFVIRGAAVFDVATGKMESDRVVVIEAERIQAIGTPQRSVTVDGDAEVIDARGKFVIPGLIDAHVHLVHLAEKTHVTGDEFLPLFLAAGVTSVRSTGDAIVAEVGVANYAASHPQLCPRVFLASPLIDRDPPIHPDVGHALTDPT